MRIILATDAWEPQLNGVARTLKQTTTLLGEMGHEVRVIHPGLFPSIPAPFSKDVRFAFPSQKDIKGFIKKPCAVHISTEGPIGLAVRRYCTLNKIPFTTTYHTKFPEYLKKMAHVPLWATRAYIRWFHNDSKTVMAATPSMIEHVVSDLGITAPVAMWSRGVDFNQFHPRPKTIQPHRPVALYVGRVSKEKNIEEFLDIRMDIMKVVVGDGPELQSLKTKYPEVLFTGPLRGEELGQWYANADVFVFPSKTDTFGLVVLEALATGVPVACFQVTGPGEIIGGHPGVGRADNVLHAAIETALREGDARACIELANRYSWQACTEQFFDNLFNWADVV
jgi:glycosyltransferase involved in cell wall biosynthesis